MQTFIRGRFSRRRSRIFRSMLPRRLRVKLQLADNLFIWTLDWVPEGPCGLVRGLRLRWAAEEAGFACNVRIVLFDDRERATSPTFRLGSGGGIVPSYERSI